MKTNNDLFTFFLSRSMFLGGGISLMYLSSNKDNYISCILGLLLGIIIIYIYTKLINNNANIKNNILFKIFFFPYLVFIIFILLIILSTFIYSYFLPFTPALFSCLPFIFLATYLNSKSAKNIYYLATIFFFLSIFTIFIKTALLAQNFNYKNILPIMSNPTSSIFYSSIIFAILSTAPLFLNINKDITFKKTLKYYLISSLSIFLIIITITFVLGDSVGIYSYPEYAILRKIKFFKFIENIENFISISWFLDIFITLSLTSLNIKELFNTQNRLVPFLITFIILYLINKCVSNNFFASMVIYKTYVFILGILFLLLLIICALNKLKNNATNK